MSQGYLIWPILIYASLVLIIVGGMIGLSYFLGERKSRRATNLPYESGITPTGSARLRYGTRYYLVGIFFIIFDVEAAIVLSWAISFREVGWAGYIAAVLFILTLAVGLVYVWKLGGLNWYRRSDGGSK